MAIFRGEEDETLLMFFLSIMNQNWAETLSDIVNYVENNVFYQVVVFISWLYKTYIQCKVSFTERPVYSYEYMSTRISLQVHTIISVNYNIYIF